MMKNTTGKTAPANAHAARSATLLSFALQAAQQGLATEAIEHCKLVLSREPQNSDAHYLLAQLAFKQRAVGEALVHMRNALKQGAKRHAIQHAMAIMCLENNLAAEAFIHVNKALVLKPGNETSRSLRARILQNLGRHDEAAREARSVIAQNPRNFEAVATLTASHKFKGDETEITLFEQLLTGATEPVLKRQLAYGLGKIYNDIKDADKAFASYKLAASTFAQKPHPMTSIQSMETICSVFTTELIQKHRKHLADQAGVAKTVSGFQPVFIVGMPRSGTTLVEQILAAHPQATGIGESLALQKVAMSLGFNQPDKAQFINAVSHLDYERARALAELYQKHLNLPAGANLRVADKMPHNFMWVGLIKMIFPDAKIIHCTRDALDNCVSCFTTPLDETHAYAKDLEMLGLYYRQYRQMMQHWTSTLNIEMLEMRYEAVVAALEANARSLVNYVGLPWDKNCLKFNENNTQVATNSHWQVRQPIYATSVKRWKAYEKHIGPLIEALGDLAITN